MIDACTILRSFGQLHPDAQQPAHLLKCGPEWFTAAGARVTIGLIDSNVDLRTPDLVGADLMLRHFVSTPWADGPLAEHATHAATLLVGQGLHRICGIAPRARLLAADVLESTGSAEPATVEAALRWLISQGANVIAMPMGTDREHSGVGELIEESASRGGFFLAASGNWHPAPVSFPARHPAAIAVGAADHAGRILPECSRWPRLDLLAPGRNVPAAIGPQAVRSANGSSVACVVAAGAAALALSLRDHPAHGGRAVLLAVLSGYA